MKTQLFLQVDDSQYVVSSVYGVHRHTAIEIRTSSLVTISPSNKPLVATVILTAEDVAFSASRIVAAANYPAPKSFHKTYKFLIHMPYAKYTKAYHKMLGELREVLTYERFANFLWGETS